MRKIVYILFLSIVCPCIFAQRWTDEELYKANTAADVACLSNDEKDIIMFINLARMYPKRYCQIECNTPDQDNSYMQSLRDELMVQESLEPMCFDSRMYSYAQCWAYQSGRYGLTGHDRAGYCDEMQGSWAECCAYGYKSGREFVVQLLEDKGIPSLGHRRNLLGNYNAVGVSIASHTQYGYCCVIDETNIRSPHSQNYAHKTFNGKPLYEGQAREYTAAVTSTNTPSQASTKPKKSNNGYSTTTTTTTTTTITTNTTTTTTSHTPSSSWLKNYYSYSGKSELSFFGVGYSYWFTPIVNTPHSLSPVELEQTNHVLNVSAIDFRYTLIGLSLFNFEFGMAPMSKWVGYKPMLRFYIPTTKWLSVVPYGGVSVDCTYIGQYIIKDYVYTYSQDFYLSFFVGLALQVSALPQVPIEIRAEYHNPIDMNAALVQPKGFSIGAQINVGKIFD